MIHTKKAFCAIVLALALFPAAASAELATDLLAAAQPQPALSAGKYLHVLAGMAIGLTAATLTQDMSDPSAFAGQPMALPTVALGAAAIAGIAKELLDSTGFGDPRYTDVLITMGGGLIAAGSMLYTQSVYPQTGNGRLNSSIFSLVTALLLAVPVGIGFIKEINSAIERQSSPRNP
jgi:hypothetical protein